jgi:hypothetical protein
MQFIIINNSVRQFIHWPSVANKINSSEGDETAEEEEIHSQREGEEFGDKSPAERPHRNGFEIRERSF